MVCYMLGVYTSIYAPVLNLNCFWKYYYYCYLFLKNSILIRGNTNAINTLDTKDATLLSYARAKTLSIKHIHEHSPTAWRSLDFDVVVW